MTKMSELPRDLTEEVLSKVPLSSLRKIRSTCKEWKTLSKRRSFAKKHLGGQATAHKKVVMMMDLRIYLMSITLNNVDDESCVVKREGTLNNSEVDIAQVFHCDGLLLFIPKGSSNKRRVVVCNPYSGETRFIKSLFYFSTWWNYSYALGYNKSSRKHKVLRFITMTDFVECKIYDLSSDSNSWRFLDPPRGWRVHCYNRGLSLKGNTYWFANKRRPYKSGDRSFLVCFDFTRERFGPPLPLPFEPFDEDTVTLSSVREEEQMAVLFQRWDSLEVEIWVTTKIEPESVTWNTKVFLQVDMRSLSPRFDIQFLLTASSFFIDEEKQLAVVFDKHKQPLLVNRYVAYIIGVDGSLREVDLGDSNDNNCYPLACSYVPSLATLTN